MYRTGFFRAAASIEGLRAYIAYFSPCAHIVFFLLQFLSVVLAPIPSNITAAAGGMLFGTWPAFFLTFGAVALGSLVVFSLARALGRDFASRLVSRKLSDKYQAVLQAKAPVFLTLAFLFPFFPDDMLCILAGLTDLSPRRFFLIVVLARPWGLLFASALGGSALKLPLWAMVPIGLAGLALFLLWLEMLALMVVQTAEVYLPPWVIWNLLGLPWLLALGVYAWFFWRQRRIWQDLGAVAGVDPAGSR